jgi:hypothetical protein
VKAANSLWWTIKLENPGRVTSESPATMRILTIVSTGGGGPEWNEKGAVG